MAKKKKPTQLQLDYRKQVKRLKQAVRRAEKRGYIIPDNIIPEHPKRITRKSVERLKKITTKDIYAKSEKLDLETGELITGEEARKAERSAASKKAAQTRREKRYNSELGESEYYNPQYETFPSAADIVISNFRADVISRYPEGAGKVLERFLNNALAQHTKEDVAEMLEMGRERGLLSDIVIYASRNSDLLYDKISEMLEFLPEIGNLEKQQIIDSLEMEEDWENPE